MNSFHDKLEAALPDLWRYAFALTRDHARADDLVQDCAERALRKRLLWKPRGALTPWLMRMLLNIYRNQLRAPANRPTLISVDQLAERRAAPDTLDAHMQLKATLAALDTLPADQREALLLVVLGGMSYRDAAHALDVPMGTLMSRLGRARARLRVLLEAPASKTSEGS